ncbi:hypothetical protein DINM_021972 [Dirofilaria immitis]|nr:hypothetical protein [Dirofilaria immitis]
MPAQKNLNLGKRLISLTFGLYPANIGGLNLKTFVGSLVDNIIDFEQDGTTQCHHSKNSIFGSNSSWQSTIVKILTQKFNFNSKDYEMTQGVELYDKALDVCGHTVDTVLIDTAGHELYKWIVRPICDENAFTHSVSILPTKTVLIL